MAKMTYIKIYPEDMSTIEVLEAHFLPFFMK
jgi:hypothetical protein